MDLLNEVFQAYQYTIYSMGAVAGLMIIQIIVIDITGILTRHTPGSSIEVDHNNFLFRATRSLGNTNESIAVFIMLALFCILSMASPSITAVCAWSYFFARLGHTLFYYAKIGFARSICFGLVLFSLVAMLLTGVFGFHGA
ncbi:MAG: MAPEG family protein [Proteobacteria bacterium]|nr:MAPEG family protein [Pseudomonadota bacterium]